MKFIKLQKIFAAAVFLLISALVCSAQTNSGRTKPAQTTPVNSGGSLQAAIKSSPAYAEVLLRRTELQATLDDLTVEFTDEYPKVKETRYELSLINRDFDKISTVADASKLTLALGRLIVRRAELETDLWALLQKYGEDHSDVKRARRKVSAFEKAIKEILP
ncbi:MAG: hypothetical protein M3384_14415 [Acidobacteriota bacterium]|nr:hypothetical protein [Acidobacteriota bacterium]